jgi:signal transduction histidine kinase
MTERRDRLEFPDGRKSELDRSLAELMSNAQKVLEAQGRLRSLLRASQAVVEELDLPTVLRKIVGAAVELVGAKYGALGVIAPDGHLEQFIHVGIPGDLAARLGELPRGLGLLGPFVENPRPIRLRHLGKDARSVGFPPNHPPMESFLAVPLRVRDSIYGNLYLSEAESGEFTEEDEELLTALAATACIAIDNARLYDESKHRQRWASALAEITAALLSDYQGDPLDLIVDRVAELADGDLVCVVRAISDELLMVDTARGRMAGQVEGLVFRAPGTLTARALASGQPVLVPESFGAPELSLTLGPTMVIPLASSGQSQGVLSVARAEGRPSFTAQDLDMAADFAAHASVALELAAARADQQRFMVLEDRSRIAADLHDHVIQRLFAAGLGLQAISGRIADPIARAKLTEQVESLDEAIVAIRTAIFALTTQPRESTPFRHRVIDLVSELGRSLPLSPRLAFTGPVDLAISGELADDMLGVIREGLTNVAKHAGAQETSVSLAVRADAATLEISDDGVGMGSLNHKSGVANMARRAERWHGAASFESRDGGGTVLTWTAQVGTNASEARTQ